MNKSVSNFTFEDLVKLQKKFAKYKPVIGIVCRSDMPELIDLIRKDVAAKSDAAPSVFAQIPVYEKRGQTEPWKAFYDWKEMMEYLNDE